MPRIVIWNVTGMTCRSCERVINDIVKHIPGAIETEVSLKLKKVAIRLRDDAPEPNLVEWNKKLIPHNYQLYPEGCEIPGVRSPWSVRIRRAAPYLVLTGIAVFLLSPLQKLLPSASAGASIGAMFLLGVVASVSSCLASTGGFMLAYSAETASKRKIWLMHAGRLGVFVLGGAILGAIGGALPSASFAWYGILGLVLGIGFLMVSLSLLDLSPTLGSMGIALPSSIRDAVERIHKRPGTATPLLVGAATFILPCGFTQTAQALALTSGSATRGASMLIAFALGTLPVLLGITTFATKANLQHRALRFVVGSILFFFAFTQIEGGLIVLGSPVTFGTLGRTIANRFTSVPPSENAPSVPTGEAQVVRMQVTSYGYEPNAFTIKRGVPVRWEITGSEAMGCGGSIVSRKLGIATRLQPGLNVLTFTPTDAGVVPFSCSMGMFRGTFTVI